MLITILTNMLIMIHCFGVRITMFNPCAANFIYHKTLIYRIL